jgi:hypothetical protein
VKNLSTLLALTLVTAVAAADPVAPPPPPQKAPAAGAKVPTPPSAAKPAAGAPPAASMPKPVAPPMPASGPTCFELSKDGKLWSRTPEQLCVGTGDKAIEIKLTTGMPTATTVASFTLDRTVRAKCIDCNKDVYALSNPENSVFNQLAITFNGKRDPKAPGTETGTLTIGKTKFFYRKK